MQGGRNEAGKKVLALPAASQKASSTPAWSCLDGLWDALCHSSKLRAKQPAVLAQASRALLGMWQVRACAPVRLTGSPRKTCIETLYLKCC